MDVLNYGHKFIIMDLVFLFMEFFYEVFFDQNVLFTSPWMWFRFGTILLISARWFLQALTNFFLDWGAAN